MTEHSSPCSDVFINTYAGIEPSDAVIDEAMNMTWEQGLEEIDAFFDVDAYMNDDDVGTAEPPAPTSKGEDAGTTEAPLKADEAAQPQSGEHEEAIAHSDDVKTAEASVSADKVAQLPPHRSEQAAASPDDTEMTEAPVKEDEAGQPHPGESAEAIPETHEANTTKTPAPVENAAHPQSAQSKQDPASAIATRPRQDSMNIAFIVHPDPKKPSLAIANVPGEDAEAAARSPDELTGVEAGNEAPSTAQETGEIAMAAGSDPLVSSVVHSEVLVPPEMAIAAPQSTLEDAEADGEAPLRIPDSVDLAMEGDSSAATVPAQTSSTIAMSHHEPADAIFDVSNTIGDTEASPATQDSHKTVMEVETALSTSPAVQSYVTPSEHTNSAALLSDFVPTGVDIKTEAQSTAPASTELTMTATTTSPSSARLQGRSEANTAPKDAATTSRSLQEAPQPAVDPEAPPIAPASSHQTAQQQTATIDVQTTPVELVSDPQQPSSEGKTSLIEEMRDEDEDARGSLELSDPVPRFEKIAGDGNAHESEEDMEDDEENDAIMNIDERAGEDNNAAAPSVPNEVGGSTPMPPTIEDDTIPKAKTDGTTDSQHENEEATAFTAPDSESSPLSSLASSINRHTTNTTSSERRPHQSSHTDVRSPSQQESEDELTSGPPHRVTRKRKAPVVEAEDVNRSMDKAPKLRNAENAKPQQKTKKKTQKKQPTKAEDDGSNAKKRPITNAVGNREMRGLGLLPEAAVHPNKRKASLQSIDDEGASKKQLKQEKAPKKSEAKRVGSTEMNNLALPPGWAAGDAKGGRRK